MNDAARERRDWPTGVALAVLAVVLIVSIALVRDRSEGHLVYGLDDAYIHMAIAKNLATHGSYGINRGEFNAAASSAAWPLLLAAVYRVMGVNESTPFVLNALLAVGLLAALGHAFRRLRPDASAPARLALLLAVTFAATVPSLVWSGLEHLLHVLAGLMLAAGAATALEETEPPSPGRLLALAGLAFATTAARFEGVIAVGLIALLFLLRRRVGAAFAIGAAGALPMAAFAAVSLAHGGHVLPNSVMVKGVSSGVDFLTTIRETHGLALVALLTRARFLTALAICTAALLALRHRNGTSPWDRRQMLLLVAGVATVGHLFLVRASGRYDAYLVALDLLAISAALSPAALAASLRSPRQLPRLDAVLTFLLVATLLLAGVGVARRGIQGIRLLVPSSVNIYEQQYQMGRFVRDHYSDATVAANDIGAINFLADVHCVDLWGLANDDVLSARLAGRYDTGRIGEIVAARGGGIALLYDSWFAPLGGLPESWTRVGRWTVAERVSVGHETVSFYATEPAERERLTARLATFAPELPDSVKQAGPYRGEAPDR